MPSIFISQATADKPLVQNLFNLLRLGCNLRQDEIDCTSVEGAGIKTGDEFTHWIKNHLKKSTLVILVITPNYFASKFCMAEMGAAWALDKNVFPLVIPNIPQEIGIVMLGRQTSQMNEAGLSDLRDHVSSYFPKVETSTARWDIEKQKFIENLDETIESLPMPGLVERSHFQKEQKKVSVALEINNELENKIVELSSYISELEKIKDHDSVNQLKLKYSTQEEEYEKLLEKVRLEVNKFSLIETRCLYAKYKDSGWHPSDTAWANWSERINIADDNGWIVGDEYLVFTINESHPKYRNILKLLNTLWDFVSKMDSSLIKTLEEQKNILIDLTNREYWEDEILENSLIE